MNDLERISFLRKKLSDCNHAYYVLDESLISDYEFDKLLSELNELEKKYPEQFDSNSPTQRVGGGVVDGFTTIKHEHRMLSLSNTYSAQELFDHDKRIAKLVDSRIHYVCELKYDGVSISLIYENGLLSKAITRGDGFQGDDVTLNVKTIKSIPLKLKGDYPKKFEIRGEIFLPIKGFELMNQKRKEMGLSLYSNPRNTASGTMKLLDSYEVAKRPLDCYLYYLIGDNLPYNSHFDNLQKARSWGFKIPNEIEKKNNINEVIDYVNKWEERKNNLPYEIDGIVIKVDNIDMQNQMGFTSKFPRWAISYKYKAEQAITVLNSITYQVGRTGAITPVANLKPVKLAGTIVKRASLHNADQIFKMDIRVNDYVVVEKGGEIIPKIVDVLTSKRDVFSTTTRYIEFCPSCRTKLYRNEGDAKHYCPNILSCPPQIKGRFTHFISRKAMNIDSLGEETIELLIDKKIILNISDLYLLKAEDLLPFKKDGKKWAENIINGIEKSKLIEFERLLFGLGIRYVGETVAKVLVRYFKTIDNLINAKYDDLISVREIGEKIAHSVVTYFNESNNLTLINNLKDSGLKFSLESENVVSNKLSGMKIVISGVFENYSRSELKKIIEVNGGENSSSISKNTTFVLAGKNMGPSKMQKAIDLNIKIIDENEFINKIN